MAKIPVYIFRDYLKGVYDWVTGVTASKPKIAADTTDIADLKTLLDNFNSEDFSSETTLAAAKLVLDSLNGKDYATQTTLNNLLTAFNSEDFASETKLETVRALLASIDGKDYSTETTLTALKAKVDDMWAAYDSTSQTFNVTQNGSLVQLWGNTINDRPDYTTISKPTAFTLLNSNLDTYVSDGTNDWVAV